MSNHLTPEPARPVIVAAGRSASAQAALRWAAVEAAGRGALLVVATPTADAADAGQVFADALAEARAWAPAVEVHGVPLRPAGLAELDLDAGLLVVASAAPDMLATAAEARCPVVVVPDAARPGSGPVVLAVAPWTAEPAIETAFRTAAALGARLDAIRVWFDPDATLGVPRPAAIAAFDATANRVGRELDGAVDAWSAAYPGVDVHRMAIEDDTVAALLAFGRCARLMVLGRSVRGLALAERVRSPLTALLRNTRCPVLIVPNDCPPSHRWPPPDLGVPDRVDVPGHAGR
ncbi:universal stress protein [Pseudonocardia acaciae]|uniref:universal stress protein n=1 Tax=Pseudonocardia acaciae TaxID=551276 RepID=UPI00048DBA52|nr:universal stress protein [Pseudonocardia acaciae]